MCEYFETHTREQVLQRIYDGRAHLWPSENCAVLGEIINYPIGIRGFNYWLQGPKLDELTAMHDGIEAWAKERGCMVATGLGRPGWARAMHGNWQKGPSTRLKWL